MTAVMTAQTIMSTEYDLSVPPGTPIGPRPMLVGGGTPGGQFGGTPVVSFDMLPKLNVASRLLEIESQEGQPTNMGTFENLSLDR